jgi:hypothetical protein
MPFQKKMRDAILLMELLQEKGATLDTYEAVMLWHFRVTGELKPNEGLAQASQFVSRNKIMQYLAKRYNRNPNYYDLARIKLPYSRANINIITHSAKSSVLELLTDPRFQDEDFLHFDNNPLAPPPENMKFYADVNTGEGYIKTHGKLITRPKEQMLVPILLYIDGAACSSFANISVEALKMSLGVITSQARDKEFAWKTLVYVPNYLEADTQGDKIFLESGHSAAAMDRKRQVAKAKKVED